MSTHKSKVRLSLVAMITLLTVPSVVTAIPVTDDFSVAKDYSTGDVSGSIWDGFLVKGGTDATQNTTVQAANANTTAPLGLALNTTNGNWENGNDDGVLLYRNVTGDFTAQVKVSAPYVAYNTGGLMARNPNTASGENWITAQVFGAYSSSRTQRNTVNGASINHSLGGNATTGVLRLIRSGSDFSSYHSADGVTFDKIATTIRADLPATLQVGLFQATFSGNPGAATFNDFSLTQALHDPKLAVAESAFVSSSGGPVAIEIAIGNEGSTNDLSVNTAYFEGLDSTYFRVNTTLPLVIPAGDSAILSATFDPDSGTGVFTSDLVLESNDPLKPLSRVKVTATASEPDISVPDNPRYGPLANDAAVTTYTLEVSNVGTGALEIYDGVFLNGPVAPFYTGRYTLVHDFINDGVLSVPAGDSIDLEFTFDPSGLAAGTKPGTLRLSTNEYLENDVTLNIAVEVTAPPQPTTPALRHRWSFTDATDSVGGADATLIGTTSFADGKLVLPGANGARQNYATVPIGNTIAAINSMTVETWFTATSPGQTWRKTWMFGSAANSSEQSTYIDFTPISDLGNIKPPSVSFLAAGYVVDTRQAPNPDVIQTGVQYYVAVVYDDNANLLSLYINGMLADSVTWTGRISDLGITLDNQIGAAVFYPDWDWNGTVDEMRVWQGALQPADIAANRAAGTEIIPVPASAPFSITGVELTGGNIVITGTSGLAPDQTYHLETGINLADFQSVPGSTFLGNAAVPTVPASGPRRFVRIATGPATP